MRNIKNADRVLRSVRSWLGTPYMHQASLKQVGCDCLGLIRGVWREVEGAEPEEMPAYSSSWSQRGGKEQLLQACEKHFVQINRSHCMPADMLLFRIKPNSPAKHLGIISRSSHFIHAYDGNHVVESAICEFWDRRIAAAFRFPCVADGVPH